MGAKAKNMNLTEGTIWKQIVLFAFPLMCSNLFQQLYNTADSMVVGRFVGSTALAAVGSTGSVTGLLVAFSIGMGTGSGVVISQYYGAKDHENLHKAVHTAMALAIALGIGLGILGVILSPTFGIFGRAAFAHTAQMDGNARGCYGSGGAVSADQFLRPGFHDRV